MKVFFRSKKNHAKLDSLRPGEYRLELTANTWDDYHYKTTFHAELFGADTHRTLDKVKILFEGEKVSARYLENRLESGWDGYFPISDPFEFISDAHISNPTQITFYEELISVVGIEEAVEAARILGDASYHALIKEDEEILSLTQSEGFRVSLQRDRSEQIAFGQGWKLFSGVAVTIEDLIFAFKDRDGSISDVKLRYSSAGSVLPRDVNLLIGSNGAGKSEFLRQLVEEWLTTPGELTEAFKTAPGFTRLIAVSYSPFERLRVDTAELELIDPDAYLYFGLRGRNRRALGRESLSLDHAKHASASSLISCVRDDRRFGAIKLWSQKIKTLNSVLRQAIDFDFAALEVPSSMRGSSFTTDDPYAVDPKIDGAPNGKAFIRIDEETSPSIDAHELSKHVRRAEGVIFFKDGSPLQLSSGQRLFSYIVINILGAIRRNSLVIIDEPELFLHPALEISLITMLKSILETYSCKALIATHSALMTREVPRDCVHVFQRTDEGLQIHHPPFQTFGADVQRISSYVFRDNVSSKPFEHWIKRKSKEMGGKDQVLAALSRADLNEELMIELMAGGDQFE